MIVVTREITQRYMEALFGDNPVCSYLFSVITAPAASQLAFRPATSANPSAAETAKKFAPSRVWKKKNENRETKTYSFNDDVAIINKHFQRLVQCSFCLLEKTSRSPHSVLMFFFYN